MDGIFGISPKLGVMIVATIPLFVLIPLVSVSQLFYPVFILIYDNGGVK